jgi:LysR family transcriptional regulator, transcriptional activator for dmlA
VDNDPLLGDLRLFCAVARRCSFVTAARDMQASQTLVSKRVAVLEKSLGVKLLHRTTRRVGLTDEGGKVYDWARRILEQVEEMRGELTEGGGEPQGPLRISSSALLGRRMVAPALSALKRRFPGVEIWLELLDRRVDLVGEGFHLDVRVGDATEPSLIGHRIATSSRILCASPGYLRRHGTPRTPADLSQHDCVLLRERNEPFGTWRLQSTQGTREAAGVKVGGSMATNDYAVVLQWAQDGHGIVLGGDWAFTDSLAAGQLQRVLPQWHQPADIVAVSSLRSAQSAKVRLCVEALKEQLAAMRTPAT